MLECCNSNGSLLLTEIQASGSTFGTYFCVTTFGESHGGGVGCVIAGCPPRLPLSEADMLVDLDRRYFCSKLLGFRSRWCYHSSLHFHHKFTTNCSSRRPGQSRITSSREETDTCKIASGTADGLTTGSPIKIEVPNTDQRGDDYSEMLLAYRPSHAVATYGFKYGVRSVQGGGRSSARETIGRVAAGAVAKKILKQYSGTEIIAYVSQVHNLVLPEDLVDHETMTPDQGLGSPVFDKLEAELAKAVMSIPATMGFEFGSGFAGTFMTGSEHNDEFYIDEHGKIRTKTNRSGGIQGGISNGEIINMRIAFKPTPTISRKQNTVTRDKRETELIACGRRDPCVVPRGVPVVEAMVALVLVDQLMAQYAQCVLFPINPALQEPLQLSKDKQLQVQF
ncbi:chorismate synthase 1, chloroplastic-like isoform X3 [Olea europaea var. sylvestris]|uniref:chorismate synthase 1, chloroplastic-like isoform X3 n=1 Tax=Olea europaea var. sylvestris TaxID=158386 RepID=UPI000C1D787E|nr:chorismate synthase 1, chloroplastic-like isoform X3 [Olea europaea var. sylvestris]